MKRIETVTYMAFDGTVFTDEKDCLTYEEENRDNAKLRDHARAIRDHCKHRGSCLYCVFRGEDDKTCILDEYPEDWKV